MSPDVTAQRSNTGSSATRWSVRWTRPAAKHRRLRRPPPVAAGGPQRGPGDQGGLPPSVTTGRLVTVTFVFGAKLPAGRALPPAPPPRLKALCRRPEPVLCYEVEVCPATRLATPHAQVPRRWPHAAPRRRRRRRRPRRERAPPRDRALAAGTQAPQRRRRRSSW